jgi:hypothetical protein
MISRQTKLTTVVAFCAATTGLAMLYVGFFLGTEIATIRLSVVTEQILAPGEPLPVAAPGEDVSSATVGCEAQRTEIRKEVQQIFGSINAGHEGWWAEVGEIFFSPYAGSCVYVVTNHIVTGKGPGESMILSEWHEDSSTKDDRLIVLDAFQQEDGYTSIRQDFSRRVDQYRRPAP